MTSIESKHLSIVDYVVFGVMLMISASIGIYYACSGGKQKTTDEFLMGNRRMGVLPVSLSLLAGFMSAITLLGVPSEMYVYGTQYLMIGIGYLLTMVVSAHVLLPIYYRLQITSAYEYLEKRFHKIVRLVGCIAMIIQMVMYMGIVLYAPALALNAVTGFSWTISVLLLGAVCTFYTTVGGIKAVMWTDVFQVVVMFGGMIAVGVAGTIEVGGFSNMWAALERGQRVEFFNFDPDPRTRHTFWSLAFGGFLTWLVTYGVNQAQVQRYLTTETVGKAQLALWLNLPGLVILMIICAWTGLLAYAYYENCDPLTSKRIETSDQLLPLFVMDVLSHLQGFPGLFVAAVFSGALSTVSSGVNSLAAITLEDVVKPYCLRCIPSLHQSGLSEAQATKLSKILALGYGCLAVALAFLASKMGNVLQAALGLFGMIGGPLLGVFLLGMLFPCANWKGAIVGQLVGQILVLWISLGGYIYKYPMPTAPFSVDQCPNGTFSYPTTTTAADEFHYDGLEVYRLSYLWQAAVAVLSTMITGLIVSALTGFSKNNPVDISLTVCSGKRRCCTRKTGVKKGVYELRRFPKAGSSTVAPSDIPAITISPTATGQSESDNYPLRKL